MNITKAIYHQCISNVFPSDKQHTSEFFIANVTTLVQWTQDFENSSFAPCEQQIFSHGVLNFGRISQVTKKIKTLWKQRPSLIEASYFHIKCYQKILRNRLLSFPLHLMRKADSDFAQATDFDFRKTSGTNLEPSSRVHCVRNRRWIFHQQRVFSVFYNNSTWRSFNLLVR